MKNRRHQPERRSLIVSSNKTFSGWAEIFGDRVAVAAMVDRLVHHAEVIVLRGDSYRLKGKVKGVRQLKELRELLSFRPAIPIQISTGVDRAATFRWFASPPVARRPEVGRDTSTSARGGVSPLERDGRAPWAVMRRTATVRAVPYTHGRKEEV
jgi:hypothetical protein